MGNPIMKDYLVRAMDKTCTIRAMACISTNLVEEACRRHGTYPTASVALGRALTGGALMGALLKTRQRVALKFEGDGPLKKILVEAESNGAVQGYVGEPRVDLPPKGGKYDVAGALGHAGFLTVAKDLRLKEPHKGTVLLYTSEIAEDLAFYLADSEQIPSAVGLGVYIQPEGRISAAGGFLIQSLPHTDDQITDFLIGQIRKMPAITEFLRKGITPEEYLASIFSDIPFETLEKRELFFRCSCSKERMEQALISLGHKELASIASKEEEMEVTCEFCRERYVFSRGELEQLARCLH
jgi:molecular chaperone Hsp33